MLRIGRSFAHIQGESGKLAGEAVVDIAVVRFVGADDEHHITQCRIGRELPIVARDGGRRHIFGAAFIDFGQVEAVAEDRFLLEIADDAVGSARRDDVEQEECDVEDGLHELDDQPLEPGRLTDYQLHLYASPAYLQGAPPLTSLADLRHHVVIGYVPDIIYSPALDYIAEIRPGSSPDIASSSINAQHALAVSGAGLCLLPRFIGAQDARLQPVLPDQVSLTRSFWLVVHRDTRQLARVAAFVDWLVKLIASEKALFLD